MMSNIHNPESSLTHISGLKLNFSNISGRNASIIYSNSIPLKVLQNNLSKRTIDNNSVSFSFQKDNRLPSIARTDRKNK